MPCDRKDGLGMNLAQICTSRFPYREIHFWQLLSNFERRMPDGPFSTGTLNSIYRRPISKTFDPKLWPIGMCRRYHITILVRIRGNEEKFSTIIDMNLLNK